MIEYNLEELTCEDFSKDKVMDWDFITDDVKNGIWRIYYKPEPCHEKCNGCNNKHGFYFVAVELVSINLDEETWGKKTNIEILYRGCAYFDGLRHVYFGSEKTDNYGYIFYPNSKIHIEIWNQLKLLENKYCGN